MDEIEYEYEFVQQSYLSWVLTALGPIYAILLVLTALLAFCLTLILVVRGKGPMTGAALVFVVPLPLLVGIFATVAGVVGMYSVIAYSTGQPRPSELADGISMAFVPPMVGMLLMAPSYALAMFGLFVRSLLGESDRRPKR